MDIDFKEELRKRDELLAGYLKQIEIQEKFIQKQKGLMKIYDYNRPTPLKDHERGLANWMKQFFASDLELMSNKMQDEIIKKVENLTKEHLYNGDEWIADYRRLRVIAHI